MKEAVDDSRKRVAPLTVVPGNCICVFLRSPCVRLRRDQAHQSCNARQARSPNRANGHPGAGGSK